MKNAKSNKKDKKGSSMLLDNMGYHNIMLSLDARGTSPNLNNTFTALFTNNSSSFTVGSKMIGPISVQSGVPKGVPFSL